MNELQLVLDAKAELGEGPVWDSASGTLVWVDIMRKEIHRFSPATGSEEICDVGQYVGAAVLRESGGLIAALHNGLHAVDESTGQLALIDDPEAHLPGNRFNDGKCDPAGRLWAGTMPIDGSIRTGGLYCLDTDLTCRRVLGDIGCSNGLAWSPDHGTMYYIDTVSRSVDAFDYDLAAGNIANRRSVVSWPASGGAPDGMAIDAEGMLWVAEWGGYRVGRWNPATGELLEEVAVPAANITSCAFGGDKLDELYITSARVGQSPEQLAETPSAGGVFRIRTNVAGLPVHSFGG